MTDSAPKTDETEPTKGAASQAHPASASSSAPDGDPSAGGFGDLDREGGDGLDDESGEQLDAEILALREEFSDLNDRHLRLAAEFNNYRRRVESERADLWSRAQADVLSKVLDVLDDVHRVAGLDLGNATVENIMEGIDLVDRKFLRILSDLGVEILDPAGKRFDPETMEAILRVPAEAEEDDEHVAQVFQKGYALKGVLIRPARVSVYKND